MPISNNQFNVGLDNTAQSVFNFLKTNKEKGAYNLSEIIIGSGFDSKEVLARIANAMVVIADLKTLVSKGLVEVKTVNGFDWYRAK